MTELGIHLSLDDTAEIEFLFENAVQAGFRRGQITSFIHGITPDEVRRLAVAARDAQFSVDAVGCPINPLRLDDPSLSGVDITDWRTLAENMSMMNGVERIVCWSGTLSRTRTAPNLLNGEEETFNSLFIALSGLREMVRGLPVQILLEPFPAHVLSSPAACVRLARRFPDGSVRVVLDAASLLPAKALASPTLLPALVAELAPAVGLVHLQDVEDAAGGGDGERSLCPPGRGFLDYSAYLHAIARALPEVPLIVRAAHTPDEMRDARVFVEKLAT